MKIDVDAKYPEIKVDLLQHGAFGGMFEPEHVLQISGEMALEDMAYMIEERCVRLVRDLAGKAMPERPLSVNELEHFCILLKEDRSKVEAIWQTIFDAHTFAWEEAFIPKDEKIKSAMEWALDDFRKFLPINEYWELVLTDKSEGPTGTKGWYPGRTWTFQELAAEAARQIAFVHEPESGRFVTFNFARMEPTKSLLDKMVMLHGQEAEYIVDSLQDQFKDWGEFFITTVSKYFEVRGHADWAGGYVNFEMHWSKMLEDLDKDSIRQEFFQVLGS